MSIVALAQRTKARQLTDPAQPEEDKKPGKGKYVDVLATLIPAEVVAAHAFIISQTTKSKKVDIDPGPKENLQEVTDILDPAALRIAFIGLVIACPIIYIAGKGRGAKWTPWDYVRMVLPALAFVGWTFLTEPSAFDGFNQSDISDTTQIVIGVLAAVILGAIAKFAQDGADAEKPPNP